MSDQSEQLFTAMLTEAGVPVTEEAMQARWDAINTEQGSLITNDSAWSPFWRLISAIVTAPCKQLVKLLIATALPNLFLKYASGKWLDVYAWGVGLTRKEAVAAIGTITFTRESAAGQLTISAGIVIETAKINGSVYRVAVDAETTIPDGTLSMIVAVTAEATGSAYNLGPGYYSILSVPVPGIASAVNGADWLTTPGADEEEDEPLRLRCRNQFSAVGQYHHDAAYRALIAAFAGIRTDYIWFEKGTAPRGPGSANGFIMIDSGPAPQTFVNTINAHIVDDGEHGHGDDLVCFPMPTYTLDLAVTVYPKQNLSEERVATLLTAVENRIRNAFRENSDFDDMTRTWPFSRFSFSQLDKELHAALADLLSVEFNRLADAVSEMSLPALGELTVVEGE